VEPAPLPLRAPAPEITAPAPAPAASGGLGLGLYLGGALDASGKTVGGQAALVIGAGGPWMVTAGVAIAPHPGARVSVAASLYESSGVSVAAEPRVSLTPFNGSTVLGGGLGARLSVHAAPWLDVVAGAGLEFDKFPGSTLVIPLFTLGLEPHL
jgi:hypothetical protein